MEEVPSVLRVPFLIVGGGIGGLTAALGAARTGRRVTVLEQSPAFAEIGAGLQLAPNAMRVLHKLGLFDAIRDFAWFPKRLVLMDARTATELSALDLGQLFQERYGFPYAVMHRADLLNLLYEACQSTGCVELLPNKAVISTQILDDEGGRVLITCQDGTRYLADGVVGADGLWSKTRRHFSDDEPVCEEYVAYRGTIPMEEIRSYARLDDVVMWIGPGLHFVQYPIRRGELYNQVAVFHSKRYTPDSDDWGTPDELDEAFAPCCPQVRHAVTFMQRHRRWPMRDRRPIPSWTKGRLTLLGDAAHPMLQYIAQGACQAIEDAACLAEQLGAYGEDIPSAFAAYAAKRTQRTARVQRAARSFGDIIHTDNPTAILLRNHLFTNRPATDFSVVDWIYGHDAAPRLK